MRRPEAVRWGPAATAQLSRRQRRKSTGTRGRPEGPGRASGGGRERADEPGQRPAVGGDQRVVAAGVGKARRAGDLPGDRPGEGAAGVDLAARRDGGDRRQQQQRDQRRQAGLLDARRAAGSGSRSPRVRIAPKLGGRARGWRAEGQDSAPTLAPSAYMSCMEGSPFNLFGDPDEFRARMEELSEQMQSSQRVAWADNAIKLAVEMTVASIGRLELTGSQRRAGDAGARRDPRPLPRGRDARPRGPRRPLLAAALARAARTAAMIAPPRRRRARDQLQRERRRAAPGSRRRR